MTVSREVVFVDFDPQAGLPAGEAAPPDIIPDAEALGAVALPPSGLYFARRASEVARVQLAAEDTVAKRRAQQAGRDASRDGAGNQGSGDGRSGQTENR